MRKYEKQLFEGEYDGGSYCDFSASASNAIAGKDILLAIWNDDGTEIMAISGQQGLTINRSAETTEINNKDTEDSWKSKLAGMKEWSIDNDGMYIKDDESHKLLGQYFESGDPVCIKIYNKKLRKGMFGGLAVITDYSLEAPYDDAMTYSITLEGQGKLTDLSVEAPTTDTLPE